MTIRIKVCEDVPETFSEIDCALRFPARDRGTEYYRNRIDRNIGWITPAEQDILRHSVVGIAGTGGMGGLLAATLVRLGVGEIRIADTETFDVSNINRQFGAMRSTIGKSKVFETARLLRNISDDMTLAVYPEGITATTVDSFLEGCSVVCDEIEFWAIGSRILLHQRARLEGISLFNCNSVGFASHLFLFRPDDCRIEDMFGLSYAAASILEHKIRSQTAAMEEIQCVMETMLRTLVPNLPEYCVNDSLYKTREAVRARLLKESCASIIATNPPLATGFLANHVLLHLLGESAVHRKTVIPPAPPGYLYLDAGLLEARIVHQ